MDYEDRELMKEMVILLQDAYEYLTPDNEYKGFYPNPTERIRRFLAEIGESVDKN